MSGPKRSVIPSADDLGTDQVSKRAFRLLHHLRAHHNQRKNGGQLWLGTNDRITAIKLADLIGISKDQARETRRRRVREAADLCRDLMRRAGSLHCLVADGEGYWLTDDAAEIAAYEQRRHRSGLAGLVEESRTKRSVAHDAAGGQSLMFGG